MIGKLHRTKVIALVCLFLIAETWTAWMNAELMIHLHETEASAAKPSDDDWKIFFGRAVVVENSDKKCRDAALLFMEPCRCFCSNVDLFRRLPMWQNRLLTSAMEGGITRHVSRLAELIGCCRSILEE